MTKIQPYINQASDLTIQMGAAAIVGWCCARVFAIINPIHAAVFNATSVLVSKVVDPLFNKIFNGPNANSSSKLLGNALSIITGIATSAFISTALGFAITFNAALTLCITIAALRIITELGLALLATAVAN